MLKALGIPVNDAENTDYYKPGTAGRRKMDAMVLAMAKTPLGRLCASDHAMHAVKEMQYLDEAFEALRKQAGTACPCGKSCAMKCLPGTPCRNDPSGAKPRKKPPALTIESRGLCCVCPGRRSCLIQQFLRGLPAPPQWRCHPGRPRCRRFPSGPTVP